MRAFTFSLRSHAYESLYSPIQTRTLIFLRHSRAPQEVITSASTFSRSDLAYLNAKSIPALQLQPTLRASTPCAAPRRRAPLDLRPHAADANFLCDRSGVIDLRALYGHAARRFVDSKLDPCVTCLCDGVQGGVDVSMPGSPP